MAGLIPPWIVNGINPPWIKKEKKTVILLKAGPLRPNPPSFNVIKEYTKTYFCLGGIQRKKTVILLKAGPLRA